MIESLRDRKVWARVTHVWKCQGRVQKVLGGKVLRCVESQVIFLSGEFRAKTFPHSFILKE